MSKLSIIAILIGFLSSTILLKAENVYDLFATGQKEEAINVLKNIVKTDSNLDAKYILGLLYNDASSINLCKIDDFCIDENESNYKKAYEIFLDLYENDNDPRAAYAIGEYTGRRRREKEIHMKIIDNMLRELRQDHIIEMIGNDIFAGSKKPKNRLTDKQ